MSLNTALAISLGVLGAVATWLFLGPLGGMLAIWAAFIAWGCYYPLRRQRDRPAIDHYLHRRRRGHCWHHAEIWAGMGVGLPGPCGQRSASASALRQWCCSPMSRCSPAFRRRSMALPPRSPTRMLPEGGSSTEASMANPVDRHHPFDDPRRGLRLCFGEGCRHVDRRRRPSSCGKGLTRRERDARANTLRKRDRCAAAPACVCALQ